MAEVLVINTGPLITFGRMGCLEAIGALPLEFLTTSQVRDELDAGAAAGHPRVTPPWLYIRSLRSAPSRVGLAGLDLGEASVIQLALELDVDTVAIDEWKGRRAALAAGLKVTGTLGLLGRAKLLGIIPALKPLLERAQQAGIHYHRELLREVLVAAGE